MLAPGLYLFLSEAGMMPTGAQATEQLRYLDAASVRHRSGTLAGVCVCTEADQPLGSLDGVLVEPAARRLRFYVVTRQELPSAERYLVPAAAPTVLDADRATLRVDVDPADLRPLDADAVRPFSEEDLVAVMFSRPAA
jgi:hypothetical protein